MVRCFIAQLLCILLALSAPAPAFGRGQSQDKQPTIQERLVLLQTGSAIEVKTKSKEKLTGKLGALAAESFEIQVAKGAGIEKQSIRFGDVKSVKELGESKASKKVGKVVLWALAGVGAFFLVMALIFATHDN
jgi:hypothetical protein